MFRRNPKTNLSLSMVPVQVLIHPNQCSSMLRSSLPFGNQNMERWWCRKLYLHWSPTINVRGIIEAEKAISNLPKDVVRSSIHDIKERIGQIYFSPSRLREWEKLKLPMQIETSPTQKTSDNYALHKPFGI